ncbi:precorrin-3B synthase [Tumidithrix elongata RA019]|uniref:Precorrin-3B synthase n=1 Tax=Tumidithrix elongata BACA0141 TaxID=2716417 RepID=A0AAW9PYZ4_9CYAN|nr:precorrin-3B synthase [Tumidithrix elongata RA019]
MSHSKQIPELQIDINAKLPICPGLFYGSVAKDGVLMRMRVVGGILDQPQCEAIADLTERYGDGYVQVTNRANLQIRGVQTAIAPESFRHLQTLGLAPREIGIDPIRNMMISPTAGIDPQSLLDVRPLVKAWDDYLQTHLELVNLSPKFSVCFDGGESVSVRHLRNDITFVAEQKAEQINNQELGDASGILFRLHLNVEADRTGMTNVAIPPERTVSLLAALAQVYLDYIDLKREAYPSNRKPRLRHLLSDWGVEHYLERVQQLLSFPLTRSEASPEAIADESFDKPFAHLGSHAQSQPNLFYLGIALPLGRVTSSQLRRLAVLAQTYGGGELRLTPWQNILIANIPSDRLLALQTEIADLGLHWSATRLDSAMVSCTGRGGCASAATHTQDHALELVKTLESQVSLDRPIEIHFSGCTKSCAQYRHSDIALVGTEIVKEERSLEAYDIYVGARDKFLNSSFGRPLLRAVPVEEIPVVVERMLQVYQQQRSPDVNLSPQTPFSPSFRQFVDGYSIPQLQELFNLGLSDRDDSREVGKEIVNALTSENS